ncbi:MAG: putative toxin-antitoxin system toxin component, PIN family [Vicinamibacterales bacterium]|jgi:putative PIN family toxin of toxin-antitoxin system
MPKNTLQGVIDTNVLIRANITENGSDYLIYKAFMERKFELLYSDKTLQELNKVLNYPRIFNKYNFTKVKIQNFITSIVALGKFVYAPEKVKICRDSDDDELISIALAIYTKSPIYIVSGDDDLHVLRGKINGIKIITANQFLKLLNTKT